METGAQLVSPLGLSAARWQVLSSVARAAHPGPVAHVARDMGLSRQSVQRLANLLVADGLLEYRENPHHKRAPVLLLTTHGRHAFDATVKKQVKWANALAAGVKPADIRTAIAVLHKIEGRLQAK